MVFNNILNLIIPPKWQQPNNNDDGNSSSRPKYCCGMFTWTQVLTSFGSDADIVTSWAYYRSIQDTDNIPGYILTIEYLFLICATIVWFLQVIEGRFIGRILKGCFDIDLTNSRILRAGVIIESIPQLLITLLVQFAYADNKLTWEAATNIIASAYDIYVKIKAYLDDDIIEEEPIDPDDATTEGERTSLMV